MFVALAGASAGQWFDPAQGTHGGLLDILDAFTPRSVRIQLCAGRLGRTEAAIRRRYQRLVNGQTAPYVARSRDKAEAKSTTGAPDHATPRRIPNP